MVYALWGSLALVSVTGVMMESSPFPAASDAQVERYETHDEDGHDDEGEEVLEEVHEVFANLLLLLAALHVGGVILESRLSGVNLARQMVTGRRETPRSRRE